MLLMSRARSASTALGPPLSLFRISGAKPRGLLDTCQSDRGGKQSGLGYCASAVRRLSRPEASSRHSHGNPCNKIMILQYHTNIERHFAQLQHSMEGERTNTFLGSKTQTLHQKSKPKLHLYTPEQVFTYSSPTSEFFTDRT